MESFFYALIFYSLCSMVLPSLFPKEEKSALLPALKLLLSLILLSTVLSPFLSLLKGDFLSSLSLPTESTVVSDSQKEILEKSREKMLAAARQAFPEDEFELTVRYNEGYIPIGLTVSAPSEERGLLIAKFLETNFGLVASYQKEEA